MDQGLLLSCHVSVSCVMSPPPKKMCKGCRSAVVNPLSCASCGVLSHPGCLGRTGHPWKMGTLLDCAESSGAVAPAPMTLAPSVSNDALLSSMEDLLNRQLALFSERLRREQREELMSCRGELMREFKSECNKLIASIGALSGRMDAIEARVNDLSTGAALDSSEVIEAAVVEFQDRKSRENNLVIFNVEESISSAGLDSNAPTVNADLVKVMEILNAVAPNCYDSMRIRRIGKRSTDKARPIIVSLPPDIPARTIIRLKNNYKGVARVSLDYTERQRQHLRALQERLRASNDPSLTIRFMHGTPTIVQRGASSAPKNRA